MASKKTVKPIKPKAASIESEPKFPYSTRPSTLRRLLQEIPKRPRPQKFDKLLLKAWGFTDTNDYSVLRVLKSAELLNDKNEPTEVYSKYMELQGGAVALSDPIKKIYAPLFQASHQPYTESNEQLQSWFNIHSGGGARTLEYQIQTFKALCESTIFDNNANVTNFAPTTSKPQTTTSAILPTDSVTPPNAVATAVNINLHIHLPENKSRRDYEYMIEDIGKYIFGRTISEHRDE